MVTGQFFALRIILLIVAFGNIERILATRSNRLERIPSSVPSFANAIHDDALASMCIQRYQRAHTLQVKHSLSVRPALLTPLPLLLPLPDRQMNKPATHRRAYMLIVNRRPERRTWRD